MTFSTRQHPDGLPAGPIRDLRPARALRLLVLPALLLAACGGQDGVKDHAGSVPRPDTQPDAQPDARIAAVDRAIAADPVLAQPPVRDGLLAACLHPQLGPGILNAASGAGGSGPTATGLLKAMARPLFRPLLMDGADCAIRDRCAALKALAAGGRAFHYHVAIVGAGPSGVTAAYNLMRANPALKVAILDGEALPGQVFRTFGRFTWINSPEAPAFSTNEFVGLPLEARDLLEPGAIRGGPHFIMPTVIADLTELAALGSGADLWQETEVTRVRPGASGLELETRVPGLSLSADRVLVTTGLGREPAAAGDPDRPRRVESFNHLTARATRMVLMNRTRPAGSRQSFMATYAGKRIAIIGAGDSANNLAEFAAGYAPSELYGLDPAPGAQPGPRNGPSIGEPGGPASVLWVNQKLTAATVRDGVKPRYHKTLTAAFSSFTALPLRLEAERLDAHGGVDLTLRDPATGALSHEHADFVWTATGYQVSSSPLIRNLAEAHLGPGASEAQVRHYLNGLEAVRGPITVTTPVAHRGLVLDTVIGRALPAGDAFSGVYLGGTAPGQLATDEELQQYTVTRNGHSLNANLPRAAALGRYLAGLQGYRAAQVPELPAGPPPEAIGGVDTAPSTLHVAFAGRRDRPYGLVATALPQDRRQRREYSEMALATLLARHLKGFVPAGGFTLQIRAAGPADAHGRRDVQFRFERLEPLGAGKVVDALKQDDDFLLLALDYAKRTDNGPRTVCLRFQGPGAITPGRVRIQRGCP